MFTRSWKLAARLLTRGLPLLVSRWIPKPVPPARFQHTFEAGKFPSFIADHLLPKCGSCGVVLQKDDPKKPGYYRKQQQLNKKVKPEDLFYRRHLQKITRQDRELLLNGASPDVPSRRKELSAQRAGDIPWLTHCKRCRDALCHSQFNPKEYQATNVSEVMQNIPPTANLVYVVSAADFPMSLDAEVFNYRSARDMQFVITKCDTLFENKDITHKFGEQFFQDYLWRMHQVPAENVHCVCGRLDWNSDLLFNEIKDDSYFIGTVNSGKLTLILSLVMVAEHLRQKLPNARRDKEVQKLQDLKTSFKRMNRSFLIKQNRQATNYFKQRLGPGISYMPGFTRGTIGFELTKRKTVYDVPGFAPRNSVLMANYLSPSSMKTLLKGGRMAQTGTYTSHYETVKENQVLTVGGLFLLQAPKDSMLRVRNVINQPLHVFRDLEKAVEIWKHPSDNKAMRKKMIVHPYFTSLQKYVIPSFYGSVDLVIRTVGYVNLTPTGQNKAEPFVVYLPKGLDAIIRQPISTYLTRTLAGRDKQGNPLAKENWASKSVTEVKRYSGKTPFSSKLIPMPETLDLTPSEFMFDYVKKFKGSAVPHGEIGETNKYANWI